MHQSLTEDSYEGFPTTSGTIDDILAKKVKGIDLVDGWRKVGTEEIADENGEVR